MSKKILIPFLIILTSFYLFPFTISYIPIANTKLIMSVFGLLLMIPRLSKPEEFEYERNITSLSLWALLVSLITFAAVTINNTPEVDYVYYIVSMWVWLCGAYFIIRGIYYIHSHVSVTLVVNYLLVVCVLQCVFAILNNSYPAFDRFTNRVVDNMDFEKGLKDLADGGRLYGIGCALDVAGTRFSAVIVAMAVVITKIKNTLYEKYLILYVIGFLIVLVVGNMISRTTTVGIGIAIIYWISIIFIGSSEDKISLKKISSYLGVCVAIALPIIILYYNYSPSFKENIRFGFEGFFSLFERGEWHTNSNDMLEKMYKLPETLHTWLIGDGYLNNPRSDPYYTGYMWKGFYMGTDVGYLRFIFYFGIFGLIAFSNYMIRVAQICASVLAKYKNVFLLMLIVNFAVWFKVSTDIFVVFAPFLCITRKEEDEAEKWEGSLQNDDNTLAV